MSGLFIFFPALIQHLRSGTVPVTNYATENEISLVSALKELTAMKNHWTHIYYVAVCKEQV